MCWRITFPAPAEAASCCAAACLGRTGLTVVVRIVDDHLEAAAKLHEPRHDLGLVEVVRDDPHLRAGIGDRPVEDGKHRFARFKSHPVERARPTLSRSCTWG